jgi:hypothetical protein
MYRLSLSFLTSLTCLAACVPATESDDPSTGPDDTTGDDPEPSESSDAPGDSSSGDESSSGDMPLPSECAAPTAGPTMHPGNNVEADEVWTADGSPHLVPYDFTIHARVEIEPCAVVQLGERLTLTVGDGGELVAEGTATERITFERMGAEPWTTIRLIGGTASFAHALLDGGGRSTAATVDLTGALLVAGRSGATTPDPTLAVSHVEIRGAQGAGVRLESLGAFTADSEELTITEGAAHPISAAATVLGTIPSGSYTGNADDQIVLTTANAETVFVDATMHDRGVPYFVGLPGQPADLRVQANDDGLATLTIEPGVELRFQSGGVLTVQQLAVDEAATGALVAVGTADDPIVMTSAAASPAAGDWLGVHFGGVLAGASRMQHVRVEYAGGASTTGSSSCPYEGDTIAEAAIRIFGVPSGAFITDTEIVASAGHGIDRGWRDDFIVDLVPTNSFDIAGCTQTWPRDSDGVCPDPVPCP